MPSLISDLIDKAQRLADREDPGKRINVQDAIDEAVQWHALRLPWESLKETEDFIAVAGSREVTLPDRVGKVIRLGDRTNFNNINSGDQWARRMPGAFLQRTTGNIFEWRDAGLAPVTSQPATDTTLTLHTTASEAMSVFVRGLVRDTTSSGTPLEFVPTQETVVLAGESQPSANLYTRIISIQKPRNSNNDLIAVNSQSLARISRIPTWESRPLFPRIQVHYIPSVNTLIEVQYFKRPDRIVSENDSLEPAVNEEAILWRAAGNLHWADQEGQQAERAWAKADEVLVAMKNQEDTFGEKDFHVEPWIGYFNLEGLDETY